MISSPELKMYSLMMNGHVDPRGSMAPPIIMRTAATPMPTPKSSLGPESILGEDFMYREGVPQYSEVALGFSEAGISHADSRRGSSTSMDPMAYDQRSLVRSNKMNLLIGSLAKLACGNLRCCKMGGETQGELSVLCNRNKKVK